MAKITQKSLFELEPEEERAQIEALELRIRAAAEEIAWLLTLRGQFVTAAESLTGGMICASLVDIPGSSNWFSDGFVTYSDSAKARRLGVDPALIAEKTAVSSQVGLAMAQGALIESGADYAVAVTGLAGPFFDENGECYPLPPEHEPASSTSPARAVTAPPSCAASSPAPAPSYAKKRISPPCSPSKS